MEVARRVTYVWGRLTLKAQGMVAVLPPGRPSRNDSSGGWRSANATGRMRHQPTLVLAPKLPVPGGRPKGNIDPVADLS
jgi:hypothetical protein